MDAKSFATPRGAAWITAAAQSPDGAAIGEVYRAWTKPRSALSVELKKRDWVKDNEDWNIQDPQGCYSATHEFLPWKTEVGLESFGTYSDRSDWLETVEVGIKILSWACAATAASLTLSGTASHIADSNWAVNLLSNSPGLKFRYKLGLRDNPGTCLMNYVYHKHWPSGMKDDAPRQCLLTIYWARKC